MSHDTDEGKTDPWHCLTNETVNNTVSENKFDDDFVKASYKPLDDSSQYLALLERKLLKAKNRSNHKKEFVKAVESTRDSYMLRIIQNNSREQLNLNQDTELEKSVIPNSINSWINPEQALTVGELIKLIKHDSLSKNFEKDED